MENPAKFDPDTLDPVQLNQNHMIIGQSNDNINFVLLFSILY